jgi:hypothetical protein
MRPLKMVSLWNDFATYNRFNGSLQPAPCSSAARESASVEQVVTAPWTKQYPK